MFSAPDPRYRIYSSLKSYSWLLRDILFARLTRGDDVARLEHALAKKFRISNVLMMPMARVAIYAVIKNIVKPGQNIILSPYTVADVINMVICAGARPVFCDVEKTTGNIDPKKVEELVDNNTAAVLATHLHGVAADVYKIKEICEKNNIYLIEDVAQAFGATLNGRYLGTIGHVGIFSIGMYKNINAWYGSAIITENGELVDKIRQEFASYDYMPGLHIIKRALKGLITDISTCPVLFKPLTYWIFRYGYLHDIRLINRFVETELDLSLKNKIPDSYLKNFTPFQARLALAQLPNVDKENDTRARRGEAYYMGLHELLEIVCPPLANKESKFIYTYYPIQYADRKKMLKWLMKHKRDVAAQHLKNCADLPAFAKYYRDCPVARQVAESVILLPTYPRYGEKGIYQNIKVIKQYFGSPASKN